MKRLKFSFLKACTVLLLLSAVPDFASAQADYIAKLYGVPTENAIVRHWEKEKYIVYSEENLSSSHFCLVDMTAMSCMVFNTVYLGVKDFEIEKETVYFCGKDTSAPVFGYFDIPTLFGFGTGVQVIGMGGWYPSAGFPAHQECIY